MCIHCIRVNILRTIDPNELNKSLLSFYMSVMNKLTYYTENPSDEDSFKDLLYSLEIFIDIFIKSI